MTFLVWVTVRGGGTAQYSEDVTVTVLVFGGGGPGGGGGGGCDGDGGDGGGGGGASYPLDVVASFVEVVISVG